MPARDGAAAAHENAVAAGRQPRSSSCETACAPVSPKQLTEAPAPTDLAAQPPAAVAFPPAVTATSTATAPARAPAVPAAAAAAAAGQDPIAPVARHDGLPAGCGMRHSKSHGALPSAEDVDPADGNAGVGAGRSGSGGAGVFEAVSRARLEATLPLLAGGSHIAVCFRCCSFHGFCTCEPNHGMFRAAFHGSMRIAASCSASERTAAWRRGGFGVCNGISENPFANSIWT